ncbi:hypothetical protein [Rheinheimera baltica]|uniref:hypothetical protein n=1 Tax=Rheinheimera baltica TaxID=67576 RepID=UPI00273EC6A9|nr:hypothetical protein [Rheinheimera baltica]MDP5189912.1 hypothetical protein [Rheinheimera baltica]
MTLNSVMAVLCGTLLLTACGGGSDSGDTGTGGGPSAPLSTAYYGMWQLDGDTYVGISERSITTYVNDPTQGCMEVGLFNILSSTANSVVTEDVETSERSTSRFAMSGGNLRVTEDNVTLEFVPGDYPDLSNGCGSASSVRSMTFSLALDYLPPAVSINRGVQLTGRVEYQYGVHFDINRNNVADAGDVLVQLQHFKSASGSAEETALSNLGANIWAVFPRKQALGTTTTSSSNSANMVQVQQNDSVLTFNVDVRTHPLVGFIDAQTPMFVYTYINYPQPEADVIAGWLDGPWNWSSETHEDRYPDSGFTQPNLHANMQMLDAPNDLIKGEAKWVDINAVSFSFSQ